MDKKEFLKFLGICEQSSSHKEKLISGLGAFLGILSVYLISSLFLDPKTAVYIVPSMGATAVLLFAVPHGPLAQPWNVIGGHLISAAVGVSCALLIDNILIAASAAVGLSVTAMYYSRCIHPPGGATALAAVIGSTQLQSLGYLYILMPVLLNTFTILGIAFLFNALFDWRCYPAYFYNKKLQKKSKNNEVYAAIKHEEFVYALTQIDSIVDVSEADLLKIYALATGQKSSGRK